MTQTRDGARAAYTHRQTGPSSGSVTVSVCTNPSRSRIRVDALQIGSVCARTSCLAPDDIAFRSSANAIAVPSPDPSNARNLKYAISTVPYPSGARLQAQVPTTSRVLASMVSAPPPRGSASRSSKRFVVRHNIANKLDMRAQVKFVAQLGVRWGVQRLLERRRDGQQVNGRHGDSGMEPRLAPVRSGASGGAPDRS